MLPRVHSLLRQPAVRWGLIASGLLLSVLISYAAALNGGLIWDDDRHITAPLLRSIDGLWRIWFQLGVTQQYYPLLHSAFWVEQRLWGDATLGYHLVNVALHATAALLFARCLIRLRVPGALLAAFLFALHPVHVESVAWISEQKNTLSTVFYLAAALAYLRFDESRRPRIYALATALFVLALLTKSVTATLPAALLVVIWWIRGRLDWRGDVVPLLPWFGVGATAGLFTAWVERTLIGAVGVEFDLSLAERSILPGWVIAFYAGKLLWPANLAFIYPRWDFFPLTWTHWIPLLALLALAGVLWALRHRTRSPLAALLLFCGTLFPVLGFFNVYPFRYSFVADHFQYVASLAPIALFAGMIARVRAHSGVSRAVVAVAVVAPLAMMTAHEARSYRDAETHYRWLLARNPHSWMALNNLAVLISERNPDESRQLLRETLRLKPAYAEAQTNLGLAYARAGDLDRAIGHYRIALRAAPRTAEAHANLGAALLAQGRPPEARAHFVAALAINPDLASAHAGLAAVLAPSAPAEATVHYEIALRLNPRAAETHANFANVLAASGQVERARVHYETALALNPGDGAARLNFGNALLAQRRFEAAIAQYTAAAPLLTDPAHLGLLHHNRGTALAELQRSAEAIAAFRSSLEVRPQDPETRYNLANMLLQGGDASEAIAEYQRALQINPGFAEAHLNLGNAWVQLGRLDEAVGAYEAALRHRPGFETARDNLRRTREFLEAQRTPPR